MFAPGFALGYHGCDRVIGEKILQNQAHVSVSENTHDWLGHGAYFWENSPKRALQWAEFVKKNPQHFKHKISDPFVIGAIIDLGNCLELTDAESLEIVKAGFNEFYETMKDSGSEMPVNEPSHKGDTDLVKRRLDCAVINFVHFLREKEKKQPFASVRGIFAEGGELYPGAKIQAKTHIQICVRDPKKSIRAYFRPLDAV